MEPKTNEMMSDPADESHMAGRVSGKTMSYTHNVRALVDLELLQTLYPGKEYEDLANFLDLVAGSRPRRHTLDDFTDQISHGVLYTYERDLHSEIKRFFKSAQSCAEAISVDEASPKAQILFLRGYSHPQWLATIAAKCRTDPEFLNSNMKFRIRQSYFSYPSLPSSYDDIVRLRIPTIGVRPGGTGRPSNSVKVQNLRQTSEDLMEQFQHQLRASRGIEQSQSIVRDFFVLDEQRFVVEQEISVCIHRTQAGFFAWIYSDAGNSLSQGLIGPWLTQSELKSDGPRTLFYPIIQHGRRKWDQKYTIADHEQTRAHAQYPQTAALLSLGYGQSLDKRIVACDPFYALTEVFRICAAAEHQFLGLIKETVAHETNHKSLGKQRPTLANLLYCLGILEAHSGRLGETVDWIRRYRSRHDLRHSIEDDDLRAEAEFVGADVISDFEHLLKVTESLSERCNKGMAVIGNNVMLEENRQAISQAKRVARLTFIAFVFVPLSFTTSLFGMNVSQLGTGHVSIAVWAAVSASVVIVTTMMYFFDRNTAMSAYNTVAGALVRTSPASRKRRSLNASEAFEMV